MPRPLADFHADVLQWLLSGQTQCEMQKEGLDRFHESIMQEVNDGRLLLGVKRMAGVSPASVAHSKGLLYSPWIVAAGCAADGNPGAVLRGDNGSDSDSTCRRPIPVNRDPAFQDPY